MFENNTFATTCGLGMTSREEKDEDAPDNSIVLRGKYHIIGENRDQLWMQILRFGFGRSVSGSVYRYV